MRGASISFGASKLGGIRKPFVLIALAAISVFIGLIEPALAENKLSTARCQPRRYPRPALRCLPHHGSPLCPYRLGCTLLRKKQDGYGSDVRPRVYQGICTKSHE